jgi:Flp pilus assembly protein TadD
MRETRKTITLLAVLASLLLLAACGDPTKGHLKAGNNFTTAGQYAEAVEEYEAALELDPDNVDVMTNLGVAYYQLGQPSMAIDMYNRAIEIAPEDADIRSNLAASYVQQFEPEGTTEPLEMALEQYQKAVELEPDLPEAHYGLGAVYMLLGQTENAITSFEKFQELDKGTDPQATESAQAILEQLRGQ